MRFYREVATPEEHNEAIEYAEEQLRLEKPYNKNWVLMGMWSTNSFYCSSLVFRSWIHVSTRYDLSSNAFGVSPGDIYASDKTKLIKSYANY